MENFEPTITRVHEDARGEMYSISLPGDRELMLLFSKKGTLRGGHSHNVPESVMVLTGRMRYHKKPSSTCEITELLGEGSCSSNAAGVIHMGEALEDTYLIEWKIGTNRTGWKNIDHEPWRAKVRANALGAS